MSRSSSLGDALVATALLALAAASFVSSAQAGPLRPAEPAPAPSPGLERYRIEGEPEADGCGGRISLAARVITLDRARGTLFADVVNRTYRARFPPSRVIAEGTFESRSACPRGVEERWDLASSGPNELRGTLDSTWAMAPSCAQCTIRFALRAIRIR